MESRPPVALLLVVIAGAALLTTGRLGQPAPQGGTAPRSQEQGGSQNKKLPPASEKGCETTPEPLRPLCAELLLPGAKEQNWLKQAGERLAFLLAMVSDPDATGDALSFDRAIESAQNAAEGLGFSMRRHWIPWRPVPSRSQGERGEATEARPNLDEPGMLLFRQKPKSDQGRDTQESFLCVFLVGESPVFGVQRQQFLNALRYIDRLSKDLGPIRIAGPSFSGSFPSLQRVIHDAVASYGLDRIRQVRLISPSATVEEAGRKFRAAYSQGPPCPQGSKGKPAICYDSIVHNDTYADQHLRDYVTKRWHLERRYQAVLSESSTDFGSSLRQEKSDERLKVGFPRGVSRLRNAYPESTARTLFTPGDSQPAPAERLQVPLTGGGTGGDLVPGLPSRQVPVTQEAMLVEIASSLRQQDIRLAQIGATDIFDTIFVAGFLANAYPEVRLYFADSDWLVPRAAERFPLVGSLSVTTFPLIAANQIWWSREKALQPSRVLQPMSSRSEVGFFNAVRALLLEQQEEKAPAPGEKRPLLEYASAHEGRPTGRPPLWLTVVGTNGYWPVALLDAQDQGDGDPLQLKWGNQSAGSPQAAAPGRIWWTVFFILVAGAFLLSAAVILAQLRSRSGSFGGRLAPWAARPDEEGAWGRAYFALSECVLLGLMLYVMGSTVSTLQGEWMNAARVPGFAALALLAVAAVAPWVAIVLHLRKCLVPGPRGYLYLSLLPCLGLPVFAFLWSHMMSSGGDASRAAFFFSYRSLDLSNGVNPVLPLLLLGAGLLMVTFLHQRRHALFLEMPEPPYLGEEPPLAGLQETLAQAREPLGHTLVSAQPLGWLLWTAGMAGVALIPFEGQQSIEGREYDWLYLGVLLLFYVLVALTWARIVLVWMRLRVALDKLACHPLRQAIAALPPAYSGSPLLQGTGHYGATEWLSASISSLGAFVRALPESDTRDAMARRLRLIQDQARECLKGLRGRQPVPLSLRKLLSSTGTEIAGALQPHWKKCGQGAQEGGEAARAGNEFLAVQYATFLGRMMLQLRGLVLYVTVGFCLAMLSTLVYPFRSHQELVWAGTVNFIVLGIPVAIAVVRIEHHAMVAALTRRGERTAMAGTLVRLALYAAGPLVALISPHFPALGRYLVSLLEPAMHALR